MSNKKRTQAEELAFDIIVHHPADFSDTEPEEVEDWDDKRLSDFMVSRGWWWDEFNQCWSN